MQELFTLLLCATSLLSLNSYRLVLQSKSWKSIPSSSSSNQYTLRKYNQFRTSSMFSQVVAETKEETSNSEDNSPNNKKKPNFYKKKAQIDYSKLEVGQTYFAKVVSVQQFGVFVNIPGNVDVLIPRSQLTRGKFEKLKYLYNTAGQDIDEDESASKNRVEIELLSVSAENKTVSARTLPKVEKVAITSLEEYEGQSFNATVISTHDFGLFAEIDDLLVEGLVPASSISESRNSLAERFPVGSTVEVAIDDLNTENNRVTLLIVNQAEEGDSFLALLPENRWVQAVVQEVLPNGLVVRPSGFEFTSFLHQSKIPPELYAVLNKRIAEEQTGIIPVVSGVKSNQTEIQKLFQVGDVVKVRKDTDEETNRVELSMLQSEADQEDDVQFTFEELKLIEGKESGSGGFSREEQEEFDSENEDDGEVDISEQFDPESLLLWWRGKAYVKIPVVEDADADEDVDIIYESDEIVEGDWRRNFEYDLNLDLLEASSRAYEEDLKEIEEEIGDLDGWEDEFQSDSFNQSPANRRQLGSIFVGLKNLPEEFREKFKIYEEAQEEEKKIIKNFSKANENDLLTLDQDEEPIVSKATVEIIPTHAEADDAAVEEADDDEVTVVDTEVPVVVESEAVVAVEDGHHDEQA